MCPDIRFTVCIIAATTALAVIPKASQGVSIAAEQEQLKKDKPGKGREAAGGDPIDLAPEPSDPKEKESRQAKNRRYNKNRPGTPVLTELPLHIGGVGTSGEVLRTPLPVSESDAVVLGTVVSTQPYLTENKKSIYTEFTFRVEDVFKVDSQTTLKLGELIVVNREGGALRLPNGRVLRFQVGGAGRQPRPRGRYVLFLKRINEGQDLSITAGYELREGIVSPLLMGGAYEGTPEATFLNIISAAVANAQQELLKKGGIQ